MTNYRIVITLTFSNSQFNECIENYNSLVAVLKDRFPYRKEFVISGLNQEDIEVQIGEGYWMYPAKEKKRDDVKIENISIGYKLEYESKWSEDKKEWYTTGNVESYKIEIESLNLKGTKLINTRI